MAFHTPASLFCMPMANSKYYANSTTTITATEWIESIFDGSPIVITVNPVSPPTSSVKSGQSGLSCPSSATSDGSDKSDQSSPPTKDSASPSTLPTDRKVGLQRPQLKNPSRKFNDRFCLKLFCFFLRNIVFFDYFCHIFYF